MKRAPYVLWSGCFLLAAIVFSSSVQSEEFKRPLPGYSKLNVSKKYQPSFSLPQKYSQADMERLAREVLIKMEAQLKVKFDRGNAEHVEKLAEFFGLVSDERPDVYSTPMTESDITYFSDFEQFGKKELYPQNEKQLVIRFYWEGLARIAAVHYKLKVVDNKFSSKPRMSRGKVSDIATTAMFDKRPGISVPEAVAEKKEQYDFGKLIKHLHEKGLPA